MQKLAFLREELRARKTSSESLTRQALARIADPFLEGKKTFIHVDREGALKAARAADELRRSGVELSPLMGIPVSIKDLFDKTGEVTRAGSVALADSTAALTDAVIVRRLREAGAVIIGRTNMVEFAFSGLGLNPHYGTPRNPWDRQTGRIPGGSSSGAAISVTDGMAAAAIGTDTGGSVRIPSALCGLTGFKPTAARVDQTGTFPLARSLDSIGPLAVSVDCCIALDAILAGAPLALERSPLKSRRFAVPQNQVLDKLDVAVANAFARALGVLSAAGAEIVELPLAEFEERAPADAGPATTAAAEAFALHRRLIARKGDLYDRRVLARILAGEKMGTAEYIDRLVWREQWILRVTQKLMGFDAMLFPTVAIVAPPIAPLEADDALYLSSNILVLRNTSLINTLDGCALSIPCHDEGDAPVGLMVAGTRGTDARILSIGRSIEAALASTR